MNNSHQVFPAQVITIAIPTPEQAIGSRIERARKARGWRVNEIAEIMDVTDQTIRNWETGAVNITVSTLHALAPLLCVSVEYLMGFAASDFEWRYNLDEEQRRAVRHAEQVEVPGKYERLVISLVSLIEAL